MVGATGFDIDLAISKLSPAGYKFPAINRINLIDKRAINPFC